MQLQELSHLMQASAADARQYVSEEYALPLDNTLSSLAIMDLVLTELHQLEQKQRHSAEMLFTLCNMLGAYIGEVFIATMGGQWQHNQADSDAPFVYVQYHDKEFPFASICYHKITRDNSISLQAYVKQAMANAMQ